MRTFATDKSYYCNRMRYYIIAGEASGDLHGGNLIAAMRKRDADADIRAWGGDKMEAAGAVLVKHYRDLAFMGFVEVIRHLGTIFRNIRYCQTDILAFRPDVLVLIDYPGFNLRIAKWAKTQGIRVVYYISPQVWAWKESRVTSIKRDVDQLLVILPFEVDFYKRHGMTVDYVGHPLMDVVKKEQDEVPVSPLSDKPLIALLPGSRAQEIKQQLAMMLTVVKYYPEYQFVVAGAPAQPDELYEDIIGEAPVLLVRNQTYNVLKQARAALVTSGTATLETALFGVPQVVCYRGNPVSYWLARKLVNVKYISLVNLIMDSQVVKELIQDDFNEAALHTELDLLLQDSIERDRQTESYKNLAGILGSGDASEAAAKLIIDSTEAGSEVD